MDRMTGEIEYNELKKVMEELGKDFVAELKAEIVRKGKVATGDLLNSINYRLVQSNNGWTIEIISDNYLTYVDRGRRPGKMPPSNKLVPWVEARGIKIMNKEGGKLMTEKQVAYIIARAIGKKGIKPTNIINEVRQNLILKYEDKIKVAMGKDYMTYIKEIII